MKYSHERQIRDKNMRHRIIKLGSATLLGVVLALGPSSIANADTVSPKSLCEFMPTGQWANDTDCDGIDNAKDILPNFPELSNDVDEDGIINMFDLNPYVPLYVGTPAPESGYNRHQPPVTTSPSVPYISGTWARIFNTDRDNDGLINPIDAHPDNPDWDNDGILDGLDPDPNSSSKLDQRRDDEKRADVKRQQAQLEQKRLEQKRQQSQQDQQRQQNQSDQQRLDQQRQQAQQDQQRQDQQRQQNQLDQQRRQDQLNQQRLDQQRQDQQRRDQQRLDSQRSGY